MAGTIQKRPVSVLRKISVAGVPISATSYEQVASQCHLWITEKRSAFSDLIGEVVPSRYICVTSVHGVVSARQDKKFHSILSQADIATPDGMPVVWALRSLGFPEQQRVYGPTLMAAICEQASREGHRIFLYGARSQTLTLLQKKLEEKFRPLLICGSISPPFRPLTKDEDDEIINQINEAKPDIVFVGISTPKQERWMAEHKACFSGLVMIGVGAAFDFHAGNLRQAPSWMQQRGLEWLFRLVIEPARLWKRYLLITPRFLPLWGFQMLRWYMTRGGAPISFRLTRTEAQLLEVEAAFMGMSVPEYVRSKVVAAE